MHVPRATHASLGECYSTGQSPHPCMPLRACSIGAKVSTGSHATGRLWSLLLRAFPRHFMPLGTILADATKLIDCAPCVHAECSPLCAEAVRGALVVHQAGKSPPTSKLPMREKTKKERDRDRIFSLKAMWISYIDL